jgi:hypothetical protein
MSNVNDVRQRRQGTKNLENDSSLAPDDEPLDEDDQEMIIQQIHDEFARQQQFVEFMFTTLCRIAALISLLVTITIQYRKSITVSTKNDSAADSDNLTAVLRWTHGTLAFVIDLFIPLITLKWKGKDRCLNIGSGSITFSSWYCIYLPMLVTLPVASIAVWIARKENDEESKYFHYCFVISNLLLIGSALVLQMDENQFVTSIHDLKASKYQYKAL